MKRMRQLSAVGVVLMSAACDDATRTVSDPRLTPPTAQVMSSSTAFTHPAGVIELTCPLSGSPYALDISPDPSTPGSLDYAYITRLNAGSVVRLDLFKSISAFCELSATITVGSQPTGVAFHPASRAAWVANLSSNSVSVIDRQRGVGKDGQVRAMSLSGPLAVIAQPGEGATPVGDVTPGGGMIYVSNSTGAVFAFNAVTDVLVGTLTFSSRVNSFAFHPNGRWLYASLSSGEVKEIDTRANNDAGWAVNRTFTTGGLALGGLVVSLDGTELWVADASGERLVVIEIASGGVVATVPLGQGPFDVALSPDNVQLYVSLPVLGAIKVVDRVSRNVVNTIATGGVPRELDFTFAGDRAVIADESGQFHILR